jgi:HK97 family phage prohead protease
VSLGPIEYGDGGFIISVDSKSQGQYRAPSSSRATAFRYAPKVIEGFACLYLKPHWYKDRVEVHERGCFNETLSRKDRVFLCIDHDDSYSLGNTDDGSLELIDAPKGLAFRLRVKSQDDLDRLQGRTAMSVKYAESEYEVREVAGENVRFIKSGKLVECSAVFRGAVPQTHLIVSDAKSVGNFRDDCQWKFANDNAFVDLKRALARLQ